MSFPAKTTFIVDWTTFPDSVTPGTYTPAQLKALFNERDQELLDFVNSILAVLVSAVLGSSGADSIGIGNSGSLVGSTVAAQMASAGAQIASIMAGVTPNYTLPLDTAFKFAANISETLSSVTGSLDFKEI